MGPALQSPIHEVHDDVRQKAGAAPSGSASFALPTMPVLPLIEATAKLALDQAVAQFGTSVEEAVLTYGDQIRAVVSDNVLAYVAKVATDLRQLSAPVSPRPGQ